MINIDHNLVLPMDLSQLSKETLISIINDLQDQIKQLKQETTQTTIYDVNSQAESIPDKSVIDFGEGVIRYKKDGKYYHGVGPKEEKYKWYRERDEVKLGSMFIYRNTSKKLPNPNKWDFHKDTNFCTNCVCVEDNPRRSYLNYQCLGHPIE